MGKQTKLREAQLRAADSALAVRLRAHTPARTEPAFVNSFAEFAPAYCDRIETYRGLALRAPEAWRCSLRVRSPEQRFLELVRFTFATYPIPHHLENAWIDEDADEWRRAGEGDAERPDFRRWSIAVGRGESLHRNMARGFMSKLECHHFVTAPAAIDSTQRAFWYAFARAQTGDAAVAMRIARTKLVRFPITEPFWKETARFFAQNPAGIHEMDDLIDFFRAWRGEVDGLSLKGRSLAALRRRMAAWHREQRAIGRSIRWNGRALPDGRVETSLADDVRAVWRFKQIKSSVVLAQEGARMHHCVASYLDWCISGEVSIWSVSREHPAGTVRKCLTLEVNKAGCVAQCRGVANRLPTAVEVAAIKQWAAENGLACWF